MQTPPPLDVITAHARRLGFTLLGVAPPGPLPTYERYCDWIRAGHAGSMAYLERRADERRDLREVWPDARVALVLALNYRYAAERPEPAPANAGIISAYAWGEDYHEFCWRQLDLLLASIQADLGDHVEGRAYVDTGPILERDLGEQAGLGWHGKNTMLIHPEHGSWFLLAELLLNAELPLSAATVPDRCGACTRCLDACPTGAFTAPHVLDARRCISYLTIEHRGSIPRELRPLIGGHVFGCDVCQDVCPWNIKAARLGRGLTELDVFAPRAGVLAPDLVDLLGITSAGFRDRFAGSPVLRARRAGFVRNVAVALANVGNDRAIEPLERALGDGSALVREHAGWALARIAGTKSVPSLNRAIENEPDPHTREDLQRSAAEVGSSSSP